MENLRDIDAVKSAVYSLFWFRADLCLEDAIAFRRRLDQPWFPPEEYETCSMDTQVLAQIYIYYIQDNCCNDQIENYYPMLDNIVEWMDETYGAN